MPNQKKKTTNLIEIEPAETENLLNETEEKPKKGFFKKLRKSFREKNPKTYKAAKQAGKGVVAALPAIGTVIGVTTAAAIGLPPLEIVAYTSVGMLSGAAGKGIIDAVRNKGLETKADFIRKNLVNTQKATKYKQDTLQLIKENYASWDKPQKNAAIEILLDDLRKQTDNESNLESIKYKQEKLKFIKKHYLTLDKEQQKAAFQFILCDESGKSDYKNEVTPLSNYEQSVPSSIVYHADIHQEHYASAPSTTNKLDSVSSMLQDSKLTNPFCY